MAATDLKLIDTKIQFIDGEVVFFDPEGEPVASFHVAELFKWIEELNQDNALGVDGAYHAVIMELIMEGGPYDDNEEG